MPSSNMTLQSFFSRATRLFPEKTVVSCPPDGDVRYTYEDFADRVAGLAAGLTKLDSLEGTRVGTIGYNHHRHYEAYFAVPLAGGQLHTINAVLPDEHVSYIVNDAADTILLVDPGEPFETVERVWDDLESVEHVVVMDSTVPATALPVTAFDDLVLEEATVEWPDLDPERPGSMCYTSGTTGKPKGVEYTQSMLYAHGMMLMSPASMGVGESDVVLHTVPMYHVNAWGLPYAATVAGAKQVFPGPSPSIETLAMLIEEEGVTLTGGVPTVWISMLEYLDEHDADISSLERIVAGGSAVPEGVMRRYEEEYGVTIDQAWGMTETMSISTVSRPKSYMADWPKADQFEKRAKQGILTPSLDMTVVDTTGEEVPWDGETFGELWIRGPTVVSEYYNRPDATAESFEGDWLKTGDIVTVDEHGYIELVDRDKDIIKSGGEYISSIELENRLMEHDGVSEAAVFAIPHEKWQERPVATLSLRPGSDLTADEVREFLAQSYPSWWLPDTILFVDEVPKTATGKFDKKRLRNQFEAATLEQTPDR
ncbi:long-chain fatty acid--CoA ligase [Haladaptatus sp. GCM10025707]|uniref:long-chain fatty acid--CoA ligase n=1 Tax=unclassified Haladaptatus TaxID=2622732 RepID=UPI0023E7B8E7|nr:MULTISPECIES: long-chain fatty acid--CoA ligase [unclassified Haladaptatus]